MLQYIILLGVINIVFSFLWKWVVAVPITLLLYWLKLRKGVHIFKALGSYLLVSLTVLVTLAAINQCGSLLLAIFFPIIGGLVLFLGFASNTYETQEKAIMLEDYEKAEKYFKYDVFFMIGSIVLFIVSLFIPILVSNPITIWLYKIINLAINIHIIGLLLAICGAIFLLNILWSGIIAAVFLASLISKKITQG